MIITTLVENLVYEKGLKAEQGLSVHIDAGHSQLLMDTGQTNMYYDNARKLGVDIRKVDLLVISHGHFDHTGGLPLFIEKNSKAKIAVKPEAFIPKYKNKKNIGAPVKCNIPKDRLIKLKSVFEVTKNVYVFTKIKCFYPYDIHTKNFYTENDKSRVPDAFNDELFLCVVHNEKLVILSSCSHLGITNIAETARKHFNLPVSWVIGGFHIKNSTSGEVQHIIKYFNDNKIENIGVSHCTGIENYFILKNKCSANVIYNYTGKQIKI